MVLILQPYCIHCENTTFRVILKMVPPKRSKENEPKRRNQRIGREMAKWAIFGQKAPGRMPITIEVIVDQKKTS